MEARSAGLLSGTPIDILPDEVLSRIFRLVVRPHYEDNLPLVPLQLILGEVSAHWRRIVWHTPDVWETSAMKITSTNLNNVVDMLKSCFINCGALSCSVILDMEELDHLPWSTSRECLNGLGNTISQYASKLHSIRLHCPPPYWLRPLGNHCSSLRQLQLSWTPPPPGAHVNLITYGTREWRKKFKIVQLPWHNLTHLSLYSAPVNVAIELLRGCPDLTEVMSMKALGSSEDTGNPSKFDLEPYPPPLALPKLRYLKWDSQLLVGDRCGPRHGWDDYLLHSTRLPALQHIGWAFPLARSSRDAFSKFIAENKHEINTFEFIGSQLVSSWLKSTLIVLGPKLTQVICNGPPPSALQPLLNTLRESISQFPHLQSLKFVCGQRECIESSILMDPLRDFIQVLKQMVEAGKFVFELENVEISWSNEDRMSLARFSDGKFHLEVVQNGSRMDL
ncbi:hypothetical protein NP233_g12715 [Leucocoprinus birnbaumii]|uniref:F-box domain-containing protein n=1 Tax=Leucocoprinus birnbaumii TaxID=56174 RepID=A0AAD5YPS3_9AGAR|nr:hypothetical protein NP233_g12715 [Leucocoprinus birnbaumii]